MKTLTHPPSIRFVHFGKALNDVYIVFYLKKINYF